MRSLLALNQRVMWGKPKVKLRRFAGFIVFLCLSLPCYAQTGTSTWVKVGTDGKLQYTPDSLGNTIPDFSRVGYQFGEEAIPTVPVVKTITALTGDNRAHIQAAIDEVAARPLDANGFRGAILLTKGEYEISNQLNIRASGVVIRGEGTSLSDGTRLVASANIQYTLFNVSGTASPAETTGTRVKVTDSYVPVGSKSFNVVSAAGFSVGDEIIFRVEPKDAWITLIGTASYGWTASAYRMSYLRVITKIEGNKIFIDAPVVDMVEATYKDAYIYKYTWNKIENIGFENIRFSSVYDSARDELHGWTAIAFDRMRHGWVRNSDFYHFGYSAVYVKDWGANISVLNCQNLDPISKTEGGRKYSFNLNGQLSLVKNCRTDKGRHDYVTGSNTAGPNAFVSSNATNMKADIGPHHRWATGLLFDNVTGNGEQNVQNRGSSGSGHGWAGAQTLFWNCTSSRFRVQMPPKHLNWAIGCKGIVTDDGNYVDGFRGIWESTGNAIGAIPSLYEKQLADRLSNIAPCLPAAASADDGNGNVATNVLDGNINTRWSANGNGQWIQFCLGNIENVDGVKLAFYLGDARVYNFDISISIDGTNFTTVAPNQHSSGTSLNLQTFSFTARQAKYIRITGRGNSVNTWNSYTEAQVQVQGQNEVPTVSITAPANNAVFVAPASIIINANAADNDGIITKVEFFQGTIKLGEDLTTPYSFTWSNVASGNYNLTAKATDDDGAVTTSAVVAVVVNDNQAPSASITSPSSGAIFVTPTDVVINASANDNDGTVTKVEFFEGSTKLGEDTSSPYAYTWTDVAAGTYSLTVKATDNGGATTISSAVSITVNANQAPLVSITSPANGATFIAPASVTINATSTDNDGTVTKVEFFQGATKLGEDTSSPYSFTWSNVATGSYSLTAIATDNGGAATTSAAVSITVNPNQAPLVSITSPANGATFIAPASVAINATSTDNDGTVTKVEFFQGALKLGEDTSSPYSFTWSNVSTGTYSLTAKATDNGGAVTTSAAVSITVNANQVPSVNITSPANGATFTAPASVAINATSTDNDGTVTKVEFFQGTTKLGEDTTTPYSFSWSNVTAGTYSLTAKATDNLGAVTTSAAVSITVNAAPVQSPYLGTGRTIPGKIEAEHYDLGGQGIAYNDNTAGNSGNALRTDDVDVQVTTDAGGGHNIGYVTAGEWMEYTVNVTTPGIYNLELRVAATSIGRSVHVELDGQNISGSVAVPNTTGYQIFQTVSVTTPVLSAGQKVLRIVMETAGFNLNYVNFVLVQSPYGGSVRNIPGKIEAEHYDLGGAGIAYNDATVGNSGNIFRTDDVDVQATSDAGGGYNIGYVAAGDWTEYLVNVTSSGTYTLEVRVAATATGKTFHVELDGVNISGAIAVPNTGNYQVFQTVSVTTPSISAGRKVMRIVMDSPSFNLNYVNFTPSGSLLRAAPEETLISDEKTLSIGVFPNPFQDETAVKFYLKDEGETSIVVYDAMGCTQSVIAQRRMPAGTHYETIKGNTLPAGLYIVKLTHNRESAVLKVYKK